MRKIISAIPLLLILCSCRQEHVACDYILSHVNIVDVENGTILPNRWVAIKGERIVRICDYRIDGGDSSKIIEGDGKYLIPGLWDMHAHYCYGFREFSPLLIANGVTGVREMWGDMPTINYVREESGKGRMNAPDIFSAGGIIDGVPACWPGSDTISVASRAKEVVERQVRAGVDFLKVYSYLKRDCYFAIVREAKSKGITFAGHIPLEVSIHEAMEAGQSSIEHLDGMLEACTSQPENIPKSKVHDQRREKFLLATFDKNKLLPLLKKISASQTWLCPTLSVLSSPLRLADTSITANNPGNKFMPDYVLKQWRTFKDTNHLETELFKQAFQLVHPWAGLMEKEGVKVLAGTDFCNPYCYPGFGLHGELELMVKGGMSIGYALKTATLNPALFLNKEKDYGTVSEGKYASLVLMDKDPLEDIRNTKEICSVFLKGKFFSRSALREMLEAQKRK